jgi:hypothetical protein
VDFDLRLLISLEICPYQHFLGGTNLRYALFNADFRDLFYFFREFSLYFLKYGNRYKHCIFGVEDKMDLVQCGSKCNYMALGQGTHKMFL